MDNYIINFTVYTLAMLGIIFLGFWVVKAALKGGIKTKKNQFLDIEDSTFINAKNRILVVRAGEERFLVSSSGDNVSFLAKLEDEGEKLEDFSNVIEEQQPTRNHEVEYESQTSNKKQLIDAYRKDMQKRSSHSGSVMKSIANGLKR